MRCARWGQSRAGIFGPCLSWTRSSISRPVRQAAVSITKSTVTAHRPDLHNSVDCTDPQHRHWRTKLRLFPQGECVSGTQGTELLKETCAILAKLPGTATASNII